MLKTVVLRNAVKTYKSLQLVNPIEALTTLPTFCKSQVLLHVKILDYTNLDAILVQNLLDRKVLEEQRLEMTAWYNNHYEKTKEMDKELLMLHGLYSVFNENDEYWYRARVTAVAEDGIQLQTLDYGTVINVPSVDYLYPLRNKDLELPMQVCSVEFFDTSAVSKAWTELDKELMKKDLGLRNGAIEAVVMAETRDHLSVVFLTDYTGEKSVYDFNGKIQLPDCAYKKFWI